MVDHRKPTREEVAASAGKSVSDVVAPGLDVLFCGINPGLYSAAVGYHFAHPGNRFWRALRDSGFTDRILSADEQRDLIGFGCGITNLVQRATAAASELTDDELVAGRRRLRGTVGRYSPRFVAVLGIGAYRTAFNQRSASIGRQGEQFGPSELWVLPNPSGLNAHYQPPDLAKLFAELREAAFGR